MEREALKVSGLVDILCGWSSYALWLDDDDVVADDVCWTITGLRWKCVETRNQRPALHANPG